MGEDCLCLLLVVCLSDRTALVSHSPKEKHLCCVLRTLLIAERLILFKARCRLKKWSKTEVLNLFESKDPIIHNNIQRTPNPSFVLKTNLNLWA